MPEVCDLIMANNNNKNLLYKIINSARQNSRIVISRTLENDYKQCLGVGVTWGGANSAETQLATLLEFKNVNNNDNIKNLVMGDEKYVNGQPEQGARQRMPIMILNQNDVRMNTLQGLIDYNRQSSKRFYTLNKDQQYAIIKIERPALTALADQPIMLNEIQISDIIMVDMMVDNRFVKKMMELKGFIHYTGGHYVFISKDGENKWSLYDDKKNDIERMTSPRYNGNVLNKSIIYLYKLVDCAKVLQS